MKRNEFKLLIENWRKNFIAESPLGPEDVEYFDGEEKDSDSVEAMDDLSPEDKDLALGIDHYSVERQPHPDGSSAIYYPGETDSRSSDMHMDQSYGLYPDDPKTDEFDDHDYSSFPGSDHDLLSDFDDEGQDF